MVPNLKQFCPWNIFCKISKLFLSRHIHMPILKLPHCILGGILIFFTRVYSMTCFSSQVRNSNHSGVIARVVLPTPGLRASDSNSGVLFAGKFTASKAHTIVQRGICQGGVKPAGKLAKRSMTIGWHEACEEILAEKPSQIAGNSTFQALQVASKHFSVLSYQ